MTTEYTAESAMEQLNYSDAYPTEAVEWALSHPAEITPLLISEIQTMLDDVDNYDFESHGHSHAYYLLSTFQEKSFFPIYMSILKRSEEDVDIMLDDFLTELPVLYYCYNGDLDELCTLIEDESQDEFCRDAGVTAIKYLILDEMISKEWFAQYLKKLLETIKVTEKNEYLVSELIEMCIFFKFEELGDLCKKLIQDNDGLLLYRDSDFDEEIKNPSPDFPKHPLEILEDLKNNTNLFYYDEEDEAGEEEESDGFYEELMKRFQSKCHEGCGHDHKEKEVVKIGVNDKCFCGSEKKYKKCCLSL